MKKLNEICFFLIFFVQGLQCIPAFGAANPKALPLLLRVNKAYYCLADQGLNNFSCDGSAEPAKWMANVLPENEPIQKLRSSLSRVKFHISWDSNSKMEVKVDTIGDPSPDSTEWGQKVGEICKQINEFLKSGISLWLADMWGPLNPKQSLTQDTYKIVRLKSGLKITEYFDEANYMTNEFDENMKMINQTQTGPDGQIVTFKLDFKPTMQGFLLIESNLLTGNYPTDFKYNLAKAGKYFLPKSIEMTLYSPGEGKRDSGYSFTLSNFKVKP